MQPVNQRLLFGAFVSLTSTARYAIASVNASAFIVTAAISSENSRLSPGSLNRSSQRTNFSTTSAVSSDMAVDARYPGTAVERLLNVHRRVAELAQTPDALNGPWEDVRRRLLWAGGLRDLPEALPGQVRLCEFNPNIA